MEEKLGERAAVKWERGGEGEAADRSSWTSMKNGNDVEWAPQAAQEILSPIHNLQC